MPVLLETAQTLSRDSLERGVIEEIIDRDDLFAMLPFMNVNGKSYTYVRENTLATGDFLSVNQDVPEGASDFTEHTETLRILAGDVDIDKFLIATMGDTNDQVAVQLAQKAKGIGRKFRQTCFSGNATTNAKEFNGLGQLVDPGQVLSAGVNGAALSLSAIDELKDSIPNGPDAYIMRKGTYRAFKALLRAAGGITPEMLTLPNLTGATVPSHDGVPILISDYIAGDETVGTTDNTCSVWAARFNEADGLHGIVGGGQGGFQVEAIGTVQSRDAFRYRMKWYVGLVLKSTRSLSQLKGITNI